ncbi:MAG TPA: hypothetical protein VG736_12480 [Vicinamibacterales bacterium]|jgi:hypothetical protein|nr:hypothetical protein [Vicinamibacterales bacterium]
MSIKHGLVWTLVVCLAFDLAAARVWAAEPHAPADLAAAAPRSSAPASIDFHTAVRDAVARLEMPAVTTDSASTIAPAPQAATRAATRSAVRRQGGGGKAGLIIGLVTTVVSVGVTLYMVKQMQKNDDDSTPQ